MAPPRAPQSAADFQRGLILAFFAYGLWGFIPVYFRAIEPVSVFVISGHRVIWSMAWLFVVLLVMNRLDEVAAAVRNRRVLGLLALAAAANGINWLVFVWAIAEHRVLETSFGYFINPLVSVVLGVAVLSERLSRWQLAAVLLAAIAVLIEAWDMGRPPYVSLILALTFALYGLLKKQTDVRPVPGLFIETVMMLGPFGVMLAVLGSGGEEIYYTSEPATLALLIGTGLATIMPLLLFTAASRRLPLTILGMMQYIAPSIQFVIAVQLFDEPLSPVRLFSFLLIWGSLLIFTVDIRAQQRISR